MAILTQHDYKVYKRLTMHVLGQHPAADISLAETLLMDRALLESYSYRHEYAELAIAAFPLLPSDSKLRIMGLVNEIPGRYIEGWRTRFEERNDRPPTADDEKTFTDAAISDATWYWRSVLPTERQQALEEIVKKQGKPDAWKNHRWNEPEESPLAADDFAARTPEEIASFLKSWVPGPESKQTKTALANALRKAVEFNPAMFSRAANLFEGLSAVYVRSVLDGLKSPADNKRELVWGPVLELIARTLSRVQSGLPPGPSYGGDDPSWLWAAKSAAELVRSSLFQGEQGIEYAHADQIRSIIDQAQKAAPQAPELEDFESRFARNAYWGAEATLLGLAVELTVLRVFWLSTQAASTIHNEPKRALELLPDTRLALEEALAWNGDSGRIAHAILGKYLSWLFHFGEDWLRRNWSQLFPAADGELRHAAWSGHLLQDPRAIHELTPDLVPCFVEEIASLQPAKPSDDVKAREDRLGQHVILDHLSGTLPKPVLDMFLEKASPRLRQYVMWFLGQQLARLESEMSAATRARGIAYWEARLVAAKASSHPDTFRSEIGAIGQWTHYRTIDAEWLIDQQLSVLDGGFAPTNAFMVIDWGVKLSETFPDKMLKLLEGLVKDPRTEQWAFSTQHGALRAIMVNGLAGGGPECQTRVNTIASVLASQGDSSFLDLRKAKPATN